MYLLIKNPDSTMKRNHERLSLWMSFTFLFSLSSALIAQDGLIQIGNGNYENVTITTSHVDGNSIGENTLSGLGLLPNLNAASRFLAQASFGADYEAIEAMAQTSYKAWIEEQISMPFTFDHLQHTLDVTNAELQGVFDNNGDPTDVEPEIRYWHDGWWKNVMESPNMLRARVAFALSEIFVVSEVGVLDDEALGLANYYDMLCQNAFGNFRDLLLEVTLHPCMGRYLTSVNNPKSNPAINRFPDENYAREIMQLFTIGLYELNPDGTKKVDEASNFIPTYDNYDIFQLAKVFTGLTYGDAFLFGQNPASQYTFTMPMEMYDTWHEPGPKQLVNGGMIEDRNPVDGMADIVDAIDHLANHPNVAPFIGTRLIQRLVKSNPSPAYVGRVSAVFNDNGSGVRGDLGAVVKAILLDPEARDCSQQDMDDAGMLREPMIRYTHLSRAFNASSPNGQYRNDMDEFYDRTGQRPLAAETVFNFFQTDFQPIGAIQQDGKVAPEFQILNSRTTIGYANKVHDWLIDNDLMEWYRLYGDEDYNGDEMEVELDFQDEVEMMEQGQLEQVIERLNLIMLHGQMTDYTRTQIVNALADLPNSIALDKVRVAVFLIMISPDYAIFR